MSRLIVHSFTISLDGYGAGPHQSKEAPLGEGGEELHEWLVGTRFFMQMTGREGGTTGIDNEVAERCDAHLTRRCTRRAGHARIRPLAGVPASTHLPDRPAPAAQPGR